MPPDLHRIRRESLRWLVLLTLNNARPLGVYEEPILAVARAEYPDATALELRREIEYLHGRELVELAREPAGRWHAKLTRHGVDVAEYTVACEAGIARPEKYW